MIHGIGTDIVSVQRIGQMLSRHPERGAAHLLHFAEQLEAQQSAAPDRFVAKRFAAKEALSKALGTGLRAPVLLPAIRVEHDALGKPFFSFESELADWICQRSLQIHLSITDEVDHAVAFVVVEKL
ncbi:MAG: Holo-[acyl-carrier-protein] synthase [Fluviibacter phosphoraccumulans EoVTN8]